MKLRCGDTVKHRPSGQVWLVAYADYASGYLAPCGWPDGLAKIDECVLEEACTDEDHAKLVAELCRSSDRRGAIARRLYRPEEEARMVRGSIARDCAALADRIERGPFEHKLPGQAIARDDLVAMLRAFAEEHGSC